MMTRQESLCIAGIHSKCDFTKSDTSNWSKAQMHLGVSYRGGFGEEQLSPLKISKGVRNRALPTPPNSFTGFVQS